MDGSRLPCPHLVIVGNGMTGSRLIHELNRMAPRRFRITVFGEEKGPAYNRILLSSVLAGDQAAKDIALDPPVGLSGDDLTICTGESVVAIDPERKLVRTSRDRSVEFDALVIATGSTPIVLNVPGVDLAGVVTFRDLHDVNRMIDAADEGQAVVIGGGLLGLEAAEGLRRRGMNVTVVHLMPSLMERQLDAHAGAFLKSALEKRGLSFELKAETQEILGDGVVTGVRLADGRMLPGKLVVMAVGIRPNIALAMQAGLQCGRGIVVDDAMRSSAPSVYAVGECVEHRGRSYGLVAPLWEQVEVCARQLAGDPVAVYEGSTPATSLKVTGIDLYSAGEMSSSEGDEIVFSDPQRGIYRKLVMRDGRLSGAVLYGDATHGPWYLDLMRRGGELGALRPNLVFGESFAAAAVT
jgi:nitrite reductase (NADH) large subunit